MGSLACLLAACASSPPPPAVNAGPLSPARVRAICDAAVVGKLPAGLSLPAGANDPLPEEGDFVVISEPRGCECILKLHLRVITGKQLQCR
ncbi:MAG TPA: hypothetical protein VFK10_20295 [Burkholderiaceae bacterium]|nr:hypothetical protein [Burkholderiaceae bacterium]